MSDIITRIDRVLPHVPQDSTDRRPLEYIRAQLTDQELLDARAAEWGGDTGVAHLREAANYRLRPYERTLDHA